VFDVSTCQYKAFEAHIKNVYFSIKFYRLSRLSHSIFLYDNVIFVISKKPISQILREIKSYQILDNDNTMQTDKKRTKNRINILGIKIRQFC